MSLTVRRHSCTGVTTTACATTVVTAAVVESRCAVRCCILRQAEHRARSRYLPCREKERVSCEPDFLDHVGVRRVRAPGRWRPGRVGQTAPTDARRLAERCAQLPPSKKLWTISERAI